MLALTFCWQQVHQEEIWLPSSVLVTDVTYAASSSSGWPQFRHWNRLIGWLCAIYLSHMTHQRVSCCTSCSYYCPHSHTITVLPNPISRVLPLTLSPFRWDFCDSCPITTVTAVFLLSPSPCSSVVSVYCKVITLNLFLFFAICRSKYTNLSMHGTPRVP